LFQFKAKPVIDRPPDPIEQEQNRMATKTYNAGV
jgi:hypothetical protein